MERQKPEFKKISVSIDTKALERIDKYAFKYGLSRSAAISFLATTSIEQKELEVTLANPELIARMKSMLILPESGN